MTKRIGEPIIMVRRSFCILICLFGLSFAQLASSEPKDEHPEPELVMCLKAIQPILASYLGWMDYQCIGIAGDICVARDKNGGDCLENLIVSMHEFYAEMKPFLPSNIEGSDFRPRQYLRALSRIEKVFEKNEYDCEGKEGYEQIICEFTNTGVAINDLFYSARLAGVELP